MIELSIAFVIVAGIAGFIANKYLDMKYALNTEATNLAAVAALEERINKFDQRINDTWSTISSTKQELEAHKLAMGMRNSNINVTR
jgi:hypothetical protein